MTADRAASARRRHVRELLAALDRAAGAIRAAERARDALAAVATTEAETLRLYQGDTDASDRRDETTSEILDPRAH